MDLVYYDGVKPIVGDLMSLRDQLLKAGLVSQEKAKKVESDARKHAHKTKKDKSLAAADTAQKAAERRRREAEEARKKERDRLLNLEREAEKQRQADLARVRQLIASHRLNDPGADIRYNFSADGRRIRFIRVTAQQHKRLAMGLIGIARNVGDDYDLSLIPRETALTVAELDPSSLLLLHPHSDRVDDDFET